MRLIAKAKRSFIVPEHLRRDNGARMPSRIPAWEYSGLLVRINKQDTTLKRIGPSTYVRVNSGEVYEEETVEEQAKHGALYSL